MTVPAGAAARSSRLRWWLFAASVGLIVYGTLFPFVGWRLPPHGWWSTSAATYVHASRSDVLANLLLYAPSGVLLALHRRPRAVPWIMLAALLLSLLLETAQAFLPGRVSSLLDMATNTAGAGAGAILGLMLRWPRFVLTGTAYQLQGDRIAWIGLAALAAWACAQLIPFVPMLDPGGLRQSLRPLWSTLIGTRPLSWWRCVVYVAGTGALTVTGAAALRSSRWTWVTAMGLSAIIALRPLVVGRQLSPEALLGTLTGVALGLLLWASSDRRALRIAVGLIVLYALGNAWQPGSPGALAHPFNWVPLAAELNDPVNAMANLADAVWPLLALACLCLRLGVPTLWPMLPLVALSLFGIQWGQHFVPGRYPGITTFLAGTAAWLAAAAYAGERSTDGVARQAAVAPRSGKVDTGRPR